MTSDQIETWLTLSLLPCQPHPLTSLSNVPPNQSVLDPSSSASPCRPSSPDALHKPSTNTPQNALRSHLGGVNRRCGTSSPSTSHLALEENKRDRAIITNLYISRNFFSAVVMERAEGSLMLMWQELEAKDPSPGDLMPGSCIPQRADFVVGECKFGGC